MKISEMLAREDFYTILEQTLDNNRNIIHATSDNISVTNVNAKSSLFVNAQLNAIMSTHPSKVVVDYLKTEYNVSGNLLRRMMVKVYLFASTFLVKPFSHKGIEVKFEEGVNKDNILIYPCNKKIRLFDFGNGVVYTMLKHDFPSVYIDRETEFRLTNHALFIPEILDSGNGFYSEKIIDGIPLARINDASFVDECKKKAFDLVASITTTENRVNASDYIQTLKQTCLSQLGGKKGFKDFKNVANIFDTLLSVESQEEFSLVVSHGDFQPGNIWWDKVNKKIVIIDWETVKLRSRFYDHAALYYNLRRAGTEQQVINKIKKSSHITLFMPMCSPTTVAKIVMAEELAYQTEELISFPDTIGMKEFKSVLETFKTLTI